MSELTPTTKALLRAARADGPSAAARAQMWAGVTSGTAGGAAAAAKGKSIVTAATAKLLVTGALLGSAVTVGIAAIALQVRGPSLRPDAASSVQADSEIAAIAPAAHPTLDTQTAPAVQPGEPSLRAASPEKHGSRHVRAADDSLAREAELVGEARGAVLRGEPAVALGALRATHSLRARALEPEELSLEARALRALGRDAEAAATEERLRARFPEHALSR